MKFKKTQTFILIAVIILAILGSIFFYYKNADDKVDVDVADKRDSLPAGNGSEKTAAIADDEGKDESQPETVFVHVAGRVKNTGVYELKNGTRVIDAVNMAGGPLNDADLDSLNLAEKLHDEEKVYVPKVGETQTDTNAVGMQPSGTDAGKVNINSAGVEELKTLSGIGDTLAGNIIDYRNANGPFKSLDELTNVPKIGPKTFENIKDKLTL